MSVCDLSLNTTADSKMASHKFPIDKIFNLGDITKELLHTTLQIDEDNESICSNSYINDETKIVSSKDEVGLLE